MSDSRSEHKATPCLSPSTRPLDLSPLPRVERAVQVRRLRDDGNSRIKLRLQPFIPRFFAEFNRNCWDQNQQRIKHLQFASENKIKYEFYSRCPLWFSDPKYCHLGCQSCHPPPPPPPSPLRFHWIRLHERKVEWLPGPRYERYM